MSNIIYNKITANNEVLIDLSTDTVTSAEHIVAGHVGHLANGTVVTGTATTGSGGTVTVEDEANTTGITCVITTNVTPEPSVTWETVFDGQTNLVTDGNDIYFWISSLSNVYPVAGERWRITFQNVEYIVIATYDSAVSLVCIGNPAYDGYGGQDDGSGCPVVFYNAGFGALMGGAAPSYGVGTYQLKLEREVST